MFMHFRPFQNSFVIQFAMFDIDLKYIKKLSMSVTFLLNKRLKYNYLHVDLFLSEYTRVDLISFPIVGSTSSSSFICLFSVSFFIFMRVFCTELSRNGWTP